MLLAVHLCWSSHADGVACHGGLNKGSNHGAVRFRRSEKASVEVSATSKTDSEKSDHQRNRENQGIPAKTTGKEAITENRRKLVFEDRRLRGAAFAPSFPIPLNPMTVASPRLVAKVIRLFWRRILHREMRCFHSLLLIGQRSHPRFHQTTRQQCSFDGIGGLAGHEHFFGSVHQGG